jgi:hypothetical protein
MAEGVSREPTSLEGRCDRLRLRFPVGEEVDDLGLVESCIRLLSSYERLT